MKSLVGALGDFTLFSGSVLKRVFSRQYSLGGLLEQMRRIGVESLTVVNLCALFIGLVLVLQTYHQLARFGATAQVAAIIGVAFVREIGPVFAAVMFAGRVGTAIAAELGSMVVTEQIDAYRSFGLDPLAKLAAPRVLAAALMLPCLTVIADLIGVFSAYLLSILQFGIPSGVFLSKTLNALTPMDVLASVTKGLVFGVLIGLIAVHAGLRARRTTEAVGQATTTAMVTSVLAVLGVDFVIAKVFLALEELGRGP
jgi:phospholipid/cholesterol/gamma-HCH transport system permease protein